MNKRYFIMLNAGTLAMVVMLCTALSFDNDKRTPNEPSLLTSLLEVK